MNILRLFLLIRDLFPVRVSRVEARRLLCHTKTVPFAGNHSSFTLAAKTASSVYSAKWIKSVETTGSITQK